MVRTVEFILYPGVLGLDVTGPLEVFHTATRIVKRTTGGNDGYEFYFSASRKGPVLTSSGMGIAADCTFGCKRPVDILLVPGGDGIEERMSDLELLHHVKVREEEGSRIVSVCKGAFLLGAAGLLDGRRTATHWSAADALAACCPSARVAHDAIFVKDGQVYSSAGVTAGIDLALAIVEEDFGVALAVETARYLVLYYRRPGSQAQFSAPLKAEAAAGERFAALHRWLQEQCDSAITVEQMAEYSAMSVRHFSRVFKSETGVSPNRYLETLRLDRAREIMSSGGESLERIAELCGFGREERLRRAFLRRFGVTPSQYRLHFMHS